MRRRAFLLGLLASPLARAADVVYPEVARGRPLRFPADHGAHPEYRTEVTVRGEFQAEGYRCTVIGRVDGLVRTAEGLRAMLEGLLGAVCDHHVRGFRVDAVTVVGKHSDLPDVELPDGGTP